MSLPEGTTFSDLLNLVRQGSQPVVEFSPPIKGKPNVDDWESYCEQGMRARITNMMPTRDEIIRIHLDFSEFDVYNAALEAPNYYDKNGNPTLTARQAGQYKPQDTVLVDAASPCSWFFQVVEGPAMDLMARWKAADTGASYACFLEAEVSRLESELDNQVSQPANNHQAPPQPKRFTKSPF